MNKDIKLKLKGESWEHLLRMSNSEPHSFSGVDLKRYHDILDYLQEQFEMCTSQNVIDVDKTVDPAQINLFETT